MVKRDLMIPFLFNPLSEGVILLDDLRDFWWVDG